LAADDRHHGDDVIGVGRVTHAEKEAEGDDGEDAEHAATISS
jgi:hypothetical protein